MADEKAEVFRSNAPQEMAIAEGGESRKKNPAHGPDPEQRHLKNLYATGTPGHHEFNEVDIGHHADTVSDFIIAEHDSDVVAQPESKLAPEMPVAPQLIEFKVEDDAVPWALSIHLEKRIQSLRAQTTGVNQQLEILEAASKKLAKRIAS